MDAMQMICRACICLAFSKLFQKPDHIKYFSVYAKQNLPIHFFEEYVVFHLHVSPKWYIYTLNVGLTNFHVCTAFRNLIIKKLLSHAKGLTHLKSNELLGTPGCRCLAHRGRRGKLFSH